VTGSSAWGAAARSNILGALRPLNEEYGIYLYKINAGYKITSKKITKDSLTKHDIQVVGDLFLLTENNGNQKTFDMPLSLFDFQGRTIEGFLAANDRPMHIMYGPYIYLEAGSYLFIVDCKLVKSDKEVVALADAGEFKDQMPTVLSEVEVLRDDFIEDSFSINIPIVTNEDLERFELRILAYEGTELKITNISVQLLKDDINL
jgi:hypothetical protein